MTSFRKLRLISMQNLRKLVYVSEFVGPLLLVVVVVVVAVGQ